MNDGHLRLPVVVERDAHRPWTGAADVVAGAVQRIDNPSPAARTGTVAALLGVDRVVRPGSGDPLDDQSLTRDVHIRHQIVGVRLRRQNLQASAAFHLQRSDLAGERRSEVTGCGEISYHQNTPSARR